MEAPCAPPVGAGPAAGPVHARLDADSAVHDRGVELVARPAPSRDHSLREARVRTKDVEFRRISGPAVPRGVVPGDRAGRRRAVTRDLQAARMADGGCRTPLPPAHAVDVPGLHRSSLGREFSVAVNLESQEQRSGWFSDRTGAYLASGKPVVVAGHRLPG